MRKTFAAICLLVLAPALAFAQQNKQRNTYKWESEDGIPNYGDSVPPEAAEREKEVLNEAGITVDVLAGKKSEEEHAAERRRAELEAAREAQRRKDAALLATYGTVDEIRMHRDRRVELFKAQAKVTELYLSNLNRRLVSLEREASGFRPYSDDPDAEMIDQGLLDDLNDTRSTIARHEQNLARYRRDEQQMNDRFESDIRRFKQLKGIDEENTAIASSQPLPE